MEHGRTADERHQLSLSSRARRTRQRREGFFSSSLALSLAIAQSRQRLPLSRWERRTRQRRERFFSSSLDLSLAIAQSRQHLPLSRWERRTRQRRERFFSSSLDLSLAIANPGSAFLSPGGRDGRASASEGSPVAPWTGEHVNRAASSAAPCHIPNAHSASCPQLQ